MRTLTILLVLPLAVDICGVLALAPCVNHDGWRIALDVGREKETRTSSAWAGSGCRLPVVVRCDFRSDDDDGANAAQEGSLVPKTSAVRFTGPDGEVVNRVEPGTWRLSSDQRKIEFTLSFPDELVRRDVTLRGTVRCEGFLYGTKFLRTLNERYYEARSAKWDAGAEFDEVARRADAPKKWNFETNQWEQRYETESVFSRLGKRASLFLSERWERRRNEERPNLQDLSSDCGPFPGVEGDVYFLKKGKIFLKQSGLLGETVIGTWSAEPINDKPASYY